MDILRKKLSNNDNNKVINNTNQNFYLPNVTHNEFRIDSSNQVICSTFILVWKFSQKNILNSYRLLSKIIEMMKQLQLQYVFTLIFTALLLILYIYNYNETMALEKKLVQINKELHLKQVTFERRQKAFNEKIKQQQEKSNVCKSDKFTYCLTYFYDYCNTYKWRTHRKCQQNAGP